MNREIIKFFKQKIYLILILLITQKNKQMIYYIIFIYLTHSFVKTIFKKRIEKILNTKKEKKRTKRDKTDL